MRRAYQLACRTLDEALGSSAAIHPLFLQSAGAKACMTPCSQHQSPWLEAGLVAWLSQWLGKTSLCTIGNGHRYFGVLNLCENDLSSSLGKRGNSSATGQ